MINGTFKLLDIEKTVYFFFAAHMQTREKAGMIQLRRVLNGWDMLMVTGAEFNTN